MTVDFYKYQGTGNDFIIIDQRNKSLHLTSEQIKLLCDRKFGVGADGLMFYDTSDEFDFSMTYFNADGNEGSMCGNGGRCMVAFSRYIGNTNTLVKFTAVDGLHEAEILHNDDHSSYVKLKMGDHPDYKSVEDHFIIDTGSPHFVTFLEGVDKIDVFNAGKTIRNSKLYQEKGINVNYVEAKSNQLFVRTYERGVEDETLSCGTGVTASAIAYAIKSSNTDIQQSYNILTLGGQLKVEFRFENNQFKDIWLIGPGTHVFTGQIEI